MQFIKLNLSSKFYEKSCVWKELQTFFFNSTTIHHFQDYTVYSRDHEGVELLTPLGGSMQLGAHMVCLCNTIEQTLAV